MSSAATSYAVSISSITGRPPVLVPELSGDLRDRFHAKFARLLASTIDVDYLSAWAFPGLMSEFGENYSLEHNLDHYGKYVTIASFSNDCILT